MVHNGTLSTNVLANADTQRIKIIATANLDSSLTERMTISVCFPIQPISPNLERD